MLDCGFYNMNCIDGLKEIETDFIDLTLTDIPYGEVNRKGNGLRELDKENADILTFDMQVFLNEVYRVTKGTIIIFCGKEQISEIHKFFSEKQLLGKGTVRQIIWKKTNPSPMNGEHIYLSGIENAVWFKKKNATFNAFCKNTVFEYPIGSSNIHPTEKNHDLIAELISDNSKEKDLILDTCCGSGSTLLMSYKMNRRFIGFELNKSYYDLAKKRLDTEMSQMTIFDFLDD